MFMYIFFVFCALIFSWIVIKLLKELFPSETQKHYIKHSDKLKSQCIQLTNENIELRNKIEIYRSQLYNLEERQNGYINENISLKKQLSELHANTNALKLKYKNIYEKYIRLDAVIYSRDQKIKKLENKIISIWDSFTLIKRKVYDFRIDFEKATDTKILQNFSDLNKIDEDAYKFAYFIDKQFKKDHNDEFYK